MGEKWIEVKMAKVINLKIYSWGKTNYIHEHASN